MRLHLDSAGLGRHHPDRAGGDSGDSRGSPFVLPGGLEQLVRQLDDDYGELGYQSCAGAFIAGAAGDWSVGSRGDDTPETPDRLTSPLGRLVRNTRCLDLASAGRLGAI